MLKVISKDYKLLKQLEDISRQLSISMGTIEPNHDYFTLTCKLSLSNSLLAVIDGDYFSNSGELISAIRKISENITIIYLTSETSVESCKEVYIRGVNYFATKPISKEELLDVISNNLFKYNKNNKGGIQ